MNIDTGVAVVILAILIFYLRLIILQRERAKRAAKYAHPQGKGKNRPASSHPPVHYSILSQNRRNWIIAGCGAAAIFAGVLLNAGLIFPSMQRYWWIPLALGIVAFSWAFGLEDGNERV